MKKARTGSRNEEQAGISRSRTESDAEDLRYRKGNLQYFHNREELQ